MKRIIGVLSGIAFLAGCATNDSTRVQNGAPTRTYGGVNQPQEGIAAEGTLMPGAYDSGEPQTGQFTGRERSPSQIGQYPIPPRGGDLAEMERSPKQVGTGIVEPVLGGGAGSLGQAGVVPGRNVSSATLAATPTNPSLTPTASATVNPPTASTAPTLASPITNPQNNIDSTTGVGRGPAGEIGFSTSGLDNDRIGLPRADAPTIAGGFDAQNSSMNSALPNLGTRVRESLLTSRPSSISALNPSRLENLEVETANGNVTLRGTVPSEAEKMLIGQRVSRMDGVRSVNNQLQVISPTRQAMPDATSPADRARTLFPEK